MVVELLSVSSVFFSSTDGTVSCKFSSTASVATLGSLIVLSISSTVLPNCANSFIRMTKYSFTLSVVPPCNAKLLCGHEVGTNS